MGVDHQEPNVAFSAFIPLLPLALGAVLTMVGTSGALKGLYLRQVEAALRTVAGAASTNDSDQYN